MFTSICVVYVRYVFRLKIRHNDRNRFYLTIKYYVYMNFIQRAISFFIYVYFIKIRIMLLLQIHVCVGVRVYTHTHIHTNISKSIRNC